MFYNLFTFFFCNFICIKKRREYRICSQAFLINLALIKRKCNEFMSLFLLICPLRKFNGRKHVVFVQVKPLLYSALLITMSCICCYRKKILNTLLNFINNLIELNTGKRLNYISQCGKTHRNSHKLGKI